MLRLEEVFYKAFKRPDPDYNVFKKIQVQSIMFFYAITTGYIHHKLDHS